ncbi:hypothetical protein AB7M17_004558 [Bradyrhizobium sp. USDA 377]
MLEISERCSTVEIGLQLPHALVRPTLADRPARDFDLERFGRRGQARIDAGDREAIRLAAPVRRGVRRALRQRAQLLRDVGEMGCDRQLRAEDVQLVQIELHHPARLQPQRAAHDIGGDEGIAVAVAADPAAHAQERGKLAHRLLALFQPVLQHVDQPRHLAQEGVVVERQAVADLVEHGELGPAEQIGLPQCQHLATELLVAGGGLVRGQRDALAAIEQAGDLHFAVHGALAADLGRMRGQDRADERGLEEVAELVGADARRLGMRQRFRQHAGAAALGGAAGAHLADVVLVLGDVGKVREIAEGADDPHSLGGRHAVEDLLELAAGEPVLVAVEPDRGLPDALDQVEHVGALLVAHGVAQDAPEQADVVAQPGIRFQRLGVLRAVGAMLSGVGWYGLEGHRLAPLQELLRLPGPKECAIFFCRSAR